MLGQPDKTHPKDWENPGRVKVLIRVDGKPVNSGIKDSPSCLPVPREDRKSVV